MITILIKISEKVHEGCALVSFIVILNGSYCVKTEKVNTVNNMNKNGPFQCFFFQLLIKTSKRISVRHCSKECLKISDLHKFKGDTSKESEDIALPSCEILQMFVRWGGEWGEVCTSNVPPTLQTSVKFRVFAELYLRYRFI